MRLLSIETSCDETAVAILEASGTTENATFTVLGNALYSQAQKHAAFGGVYPNLAKREHALNLSPLLSEALSQANVAQSGDKTELSEEQHSFLKKLLVREEGMYYSVLRCFEKTGKPSIDAIAVTQGPGLEPALWVGINFARALSYAWNIPILSVNHLEGHLVGSAVTTDDGRVYKLESVSFPILGLIISGGHTEFVYSKEWGDYSVVGATRDDSIGEAFDKVARLLGIPYPGGPELSRLAKKGRQTLSTRPAHYTKDIKKFPRPMIGSNDLDFSFSGLKTAVLYLTKEMGEIIDIHKTLLAAEFEEAVSDVVVKKTEQALQKYPAKTFALGGGVSANEYIRARLSSLFTEDHMNQTSFSLPAQGLSTDNAIMIGMAGYLMHLRNAPTKNGSEDIIAEGNMGLE